MSPIIDISQAISILQLGEVVALPTETVYGLAARIDQDKALEKVFTTKNRPFFDPLIVHVQDLTQAQSYAHWDEVSLFLAQAFWPGPLTLVLKKKEGQISDLITHAGPTVALRCPQHPLFQAVLKGLQIPLAAPSANLFGRTSPTTAQHVIDEFHSQVHVVDGGPCDMGIESSVVQFDETESKLFILRPGVIGKKDLEEKLLQKKFKVSVEFRNQNNAPGFLKNHYQPSVPLILVYESSQAQGDRSYLELIKDFISPEIELKEWQLPCEPSLAARQLYGDLRHFSENGEAIYLSIPELWAEDDRWQGLMDRLLKASHATLAFKDKWLLSSTT